MEVNGRGLAPLFAEATKMARHQVAPPVEHQGRLSVLLEKLALLFVLIPVLALALATVKRLRHFVWNDGAALEVAQETVVHLAFFGTTIVGTVVGFLMAPEDQQRLKVAFLCAGVLFWIACLVIGYLVAARRHQVSVLTHETR